MSIKNFLTLNATKLTTLPVAANQHLKKEVNTMKRSFNILFGGIALSWIICMTILVSYMLQS